MTPQAPLSTHWPMRKERLTRERENQIRHDVFKAGLNPYRVMRGRGVSRNQMDRICCHAVNWRKWGKGVGA